MAFAEHDFRVTRKNPDGATERDHQASAQRLISMLPGWKRKVEVEPEGPRCPEELQYLWRWFWDLASGISSGGFGPAVVTWSDLSAWCALRRCDLQPWEATVIVNLGQLRASIALEKASKKS